LVHTAFGSGSSAMPMDDSAHVGEADAGAFKFVVPMQALEYTE
jgi:hypothetical protein